jgi:hypothetical protein
MKIFKLMMLALVAMVGLNSCSDDCDHVSNEHDHSADLVGTWTCFQEGFAEALVIKADGSALSTGSDGEEFWENVAGNVVVENGKINLTFEDGDNWKGHFDIVPGVAFSIFTDKGDYLTFNYCKKDLSEEIVGMWVCNDGLTDGITIMSYSDNGKMAITTAAALGTNTPLVKHESDYVVVGDLMFTKLPATNVEGQPMYTVARMAYAPNGISTGDIMTHKKYIPSGNGLLESVMSFLRVKEGLNLTDKLYAYNSAYVSNAKGTDEDFNILGHTFNMANIANGNFDMLFRSELFCVSFPDANTIKHIYRSNGETIAVDFPITVEDNKVTLDMGVSIPVLRKVDMYMFQDADDTQLHMYMPTQSFINYFANLEVVTLLTEGKIDPTDAAAVAKVYADMEARVESINVSFVMKAIEPVE